jgi:methionyl-tRNA synthetase
MSRPKFYLTTAIAYPNGPPHIGHAYEVVAADAIARFKRLDGYDVFAMTGTDEHGQKVQRTAAQNGVTPKAYVDGLAARFKAMGERLGCAYDRFIRTTDPDHLVSTQELWRRMQANGDIYLAKYAGWYSVRDEAFYNEDETTVQPDGSRLGGQGTPVEWVEEESYFFRLSAYQDRLLALYENPANFISPETRKNEVVSFVKGGLTDLSISRTTFDWGLPVPGDPKHVMYVWIDALNNYVTGCGFPDENNPRWRYWPADVHIIGKDITRFHCTLWPAMLMAAGLEVASKVWSHGFVYIEGRKISKIGRASCRERVS